MSKSEWILNKCRELDTNLFFETFNGNDQILSQLSNNDSQFLFDYIKQNYQIDFTNFSHTINHRITSKGYYQNWHLDGKRVFETRRGVVCPTDTTNQSKYVLHDIYNPTPTYSILYYGSTYDKDFKGGMIEFINGVKIKPIKNQCIIFDSNLGHQVTLQTDGQRSCYLIMVFK